MYLNFSLEDNFWKTMTSEIHYSTTDEPEFEVESVEKSINEFFLTTFVLRQTFCSFEREKTPGRIFSKDSEDPNIWNVNVFNRETNNIDIVAREFILTIDAFFNEIGNNNFTSKTENHTPNTMKKALEELLKTDVNNSIKEALPILRAICQKKMEFSVSIKSKPTLDKIQKQKTLPELLSLLTDKTIFSKSLNEFKNFIEKKLGKNVLKMEKESLKRFTSFFDGKVIISGGGTYIYKLSYDYFMCMYSLVNEKRK